MQLNQIIPIALFVFSWARFPQVQIFITETVQEKRTFLRLLREKFLHPTSSDPGGPYGCQCGQAIKQLSDKYLYSITYILSGNQVIPIPAEKGEDLKGLFMEIGGEKNMEFDMLDDETDLKEVRRKFRSNWRKCFFNFVDSKILFWPCFSSVCR